MMTNEPRIVPLRLQKFLARAGVASRRGSENLMTAGRVTVNGQVVTELGSKVDPLIDEVAVDGVRVTLSDGAVTLMLNKPAGFVTTMSDPQGRPCVAELVPTQTYPGLFPIGRLDTNTTGLLLFSTDGELGHNLLHPKYHVDKVYEAVVAGKVKEASLRQLEQGIELSDGFTAPAQVQVVGYDTRGTKHSTEVRITIHEGRKRQVRRMFEQIGHEVMYLNRSQFGPIELGDLEQGTWRELTQEELSNLYDVSRGQAL